VCCCGEFFFDGVERPRLIGRNDSCESDVNAFDIECPNTDPSFRVPSSWHATPGVVAIDCTRRECREGDTCVHLVGTAEQTPGMAADQGRGGRAE
jgi:hypothetical protein